MTDLKKIRAVGFDLDGTLYKSNKSIDDRIKKERQDAQQQAMQMKKDEEVQKLQAEVAQLQAELGTKERVATGKDDVNIQKINVKRAELNLPPLPTSKEQQAAPQAGNPQQPPQQGGQQQLPL